MDGDGCIYFNKGIPYVKFTNANIEFLEYINKKIYSLSGIKGSIYTEFKTKNNLCFTRRKTNIVLLNLIYNNSKIF